MLKELIVLSRDDITQITGPLDQSPSIANGQDKFGEQRQQKQTTDVLAALNDTMTGTADVRSPQRQVMRLRQENRRLHLELEALRQESRRLRPEVEALRSEKEQLVARLNTLQKEFDENVDAIHSGHLQETEHYDQHLRELMEEHNRLQVAHLELEQRYQELNRSFSTAGEEEARKRITAAVHALERSPEHVPPLLTDVMKTLELRARQEEEQNLLEILSLKNEVKRLAGQLEQERLQLAKERQQLTAMQQKASQQSKLRLKVLEAHLKARWTASFALTTTLVLCLLVALQFLFLGLFQVRPPAVTGLLLIVPIVPCAFVAIMLTYPSATMNRFYARVPRKKTVKKEASEKKDQKK
jgi:chromosome segregation ATPase